MGSILTKNILQFNYKQVKSIRIRYLKIYKASSEMYTTKKQVTFDSPSYYEDSSHRYYREDSVQSIKARLAANLGKMVEVLAERKELLKKLAEAMMRDQSSKLQQIAKAKTSQLKNEARALKDQTALALLETAQKYDRGAGSIIKTIIDMNPKNIQQDQSKKTKQYYDEIKRIDADRNLAIGRYKQQSAQLTKLNDEERRIFREIELLEQSKIAVLTSKQADHIRKAERIEQQIQRNRILLKTNRGSKEKRKRELAYEIQKILQMTKRYEGNAMGRNKQISEMMGGCETVQELEEFIKSLEGVVTSRLQSGRKQEEGILMEIVRRATYYDKQIQEMQKQVGEEGYLFDSLQQGYRKSLRMGILQRVYLSGVGGDRGVLMGVVGKCQMYRGLLQRWGQEKSKAKWECEKARQVMEYFEPILRNITTQQRRRQELRERVVGLLNRRKELQKMQKREQILGFELTNMLLQKQAIVKPMEEAARKGNLQEYKLRMGELEKIQKEIVGLTQGKGEGKYKEEMGKLNKEIEELNMEYGGIIEEMLAGEREMTYGVFLERLSRRLVVG